MNSKSYRTVAAMLAIGTFATASLRSQSLLTNPSFESNRNTDQTGGGFANGESRDFGPNGTNDAVESGDHNRITGWTTVATENATVDGAQVAVGFNAITPAHPAPSTNPAPQALSLMSGAAIAQVTSLAWSSLDAGDVITMTVAVGDRSTSSVVWADRSFFGITAGLATGTLAGGTLRSNTIANSGEIASPPGGIDSGTMGDRTFGYVVKSSDTLRSGNVGLVIAGFGSTSEGDGLANVTGTNANANQAFFDNVRLTVQPAWGVTETSAAIRVETGAGLIYEVAKNNGDITSILYNGEELRGSKNSHLNSGFPESNVDSVTWQYHSNGTISRICVSASKTNHYFVSRKLENRIYMATSYKDGITPYGELRWITRLGAGFTNVPLESDQRGATAIESTDIYALPNGQSRSKYYGNKKAHNLAIRGVTKPGVGVFMDYGNRESSSGGPFFRDIQNHTTSDESTAVYNYMFSGHAQTEPAKAGVLHGPYALIFTDGSTPPVPDKSFMASLGLDQWVSSRGSVYGDAGTIPAGITAMVGFSPVSPLPAGQSPGQYWATVDPTTRDYSCGSMKPGSYIQTLYHGELEVATETVQVTAGASLNNNMSPTFFIPSSPLWRIGTWDGMPTEFKNGTAIPVMHPSTNWDTTPGIPADYWPSTFNADTQPPLQFPAIQFRGRNSPITITFNLTATEIADRTLRIGITVAYGGGRPSVSINGQGTTTQAGTSQPTGRNQTIGTWRGNNKQFVYNIAAGKLVAGTNTLVINPISGSSDLGPWLSASYTFDCLELY